MIETVRIDAQQMVPNGNGSPIHPGWIFVEGVHWCFKRSFKRSWEAPESEIIRQLLYK